MLIADGCDRGYFRLGFEGLQPLLEICNHFLFCGDLGLYGIYVSLYCIELFIMGLYFCGMCILEFGYLSVLFVLCLLFFVDCLVCVGEGFGELFECCGFCCVLLFQSSEAFIDRWIVVFHAFT